MRFYLHCFVGGFAQDVAPLPKLDSKRLRWDGQFASPARRWSPALNPARRRTAPHLEHQVLLRVKLLTKPHRPSVTSKARERSI